jgi:hypothetical protein
MPLKIDTPTLKRALTEARGDLLIASQLLSSRLKDVANACSLVPEIQDHLLLIDKVKQSLGDYARLSARQFTETVERNSLVYKVDALEELHKLALMPVDHDRPELMKVKKDAAIRLLGSGAEANSGGEMANIMAELNRKYQEAAPRLGVLRAVLAIEYGAASQDHVPYQSDTSANSQQVLLPPEDDAEHFAGAAPRARSLESSLRTGTTVEGRNAQHRSDASDQGASSSG